MKQQLIQKITFKMNISQWKKCVLVACLCLLAACKTTIPIPQYKEMPIYSVSSASTMQSVEKAIATGAASLGWQTTQVEEGKVEATLNIRKHQLKVLLVHDINTISVRYLDSKNLKYNGSKIHRQYANWITNLLKAINTAHIAQN